MVTAEMAVALPTLALVTALALTGVADAAQQLRCLDAAGVAARLTARGEPPAVVQRLATAVAPRQAKVTVRTDAGGLVTATVTARVAVPVLGRLFPTIHEQSVTLLEPQGQP